MAAARLTQGLERANPCVSRHQALPRAVQAVARKCTTDMDPEENAAPRVEPGRRIAHYEIFEEDGVPWIAMEPVKGSSLREILAGLAGRVRTVRHIL